MTDFELVEKKDYHQLFEKYKPLIYKIWTKQPPISKNYFENFDDYQCYAYEYLVNAINSIDLKRIKNPKTWTAWIVIYRYVSTYTSRLIHKLTNEFSYSYDSLSEIVDKDNNRMLTDKRHQSNFDNVLNILSEEERDLVYKVMYTNYRKGWFSKEERKMWKNIIETFENNYTKY